MSKVVYVVFLVSGAAFAGITFEPTRVPGDVAIDTIMVEGTIYHTVSVKNFPLPMSGAQAAGLPSVPFTASTFYRTAQGIITVIRTVEWGGV